MVRIKRVSYKFFLTLITGIIIGLLMGMAILTVLISYRIDQYHEEIQHLRNVIEDKDVKLKKLEDSINKRKLILKDIKVVLIHEGDEIDKITLIKHIKEKYNILLGKEVKNIDIDMVEEVIDKRIMKISKKEYRLNVTKIILIDTLEIWIETKLVE
jgi:MFS superfamily sulfate permease-like transporter